MANIIEFSNVRSSFKKLRDSLDELSILSYQTEITVVRELENLHHILREINEQKQKENGKIQNP